MNSARTILFVAICLAASPFLAASRIHVMILDGANNHAWQKTTPVMKKMLEDTGLFQVDVLSAPGKGGDFSNFNPRWSVTAGLNYMHVSNFYLSEPKNEDYGINVYGPMFGINMLLGKEKAATVH